MAVVTMQNGPWMHGYGHSEEWALDAAGGEEFGP